MIEEKSHELHLYLKSHGLTDRQAEICMLVLYGYTNKAIATYLQLTVRGVKHHLSKVYAQLPYKNRKDLCTAYAEFSPPPPRVVPAPNFQSDVDAVLLPTTRNQS